MLRRGECSDVTKADSCTATRSAQTERPPRGGLSEIWSKNTWLGLGRKPQGSGNDFKARWTTERRMSVYCTQGPAY